MSKQTKESFNFKETFKELEDINQWFQGEDIDLDQGLKKFKKGINLIKSAKKHLQKVENEFEEIKKDLEQEQE